MRTGQRMGCLKAAVGSGGGGHPPRTLGVIMLETRFPRLVGDIGNPDSFAWPVRYCVVKGASPTRVIQGRARGLVAPFIRAARELAAQGCVAITTSCGFLALHQRELAAAVDIPLATSSLCQVASVAAGLAPGRRVGVLTIEADALTAGHLRAAGADPSTPMVGVASGGEFARAILGDQATLDPALLCREVLEAGQCLLARHPEVGAIVLECTNMPPYAEALRTATGLPVYDVLTLTARLMAQNSD